ncbi:MAG TPA: hypothetical protein VGJ16_05825 [Pirellulales bacterium]|jgi:hypothetical protein
MAASNNHLPARAEIEGAVRAALSRLIEQPQSNGQATGAGELAVSEMVVALANLDGRLDGVRRLIVPRGAVLTPAARDELRKRGIALASAVESQKNTKRAQIVVLADGGILSMPLVAALERDGACVQLTSSACGADAVLELCRRVLAERCLGLILTAEPALALCLANRQRGVRACQAHDVQAISDAINSIAPNLLIVDPRGRGAFDLSRITRNWARAGAMPCPVAHQAYLD